MLHNGRGIDQALMRFVRLRVAAQCLKGHICAGRLVGRKTLCRRLTLGLLLARLPVARIQGKPIGSYNLQTEAKIFGRSRSNGNGLWQSRWSWCSKRILQHVQQICGASQRLLIVLRIKAAQLLQLCYLRFAADGQQHFQLTQLCLGLGVHNGRPAINGNDRQLVIGRGKVRE